MTPTTAFWWRLFGLLAIEAALVAALATVLARWIRSAVWRRTIWQAGVLGLLVLAAGESTGLNRGLAAWATAKPEARRSRRMVVRAFPPRIQAAPPIASNDPDAASELKIINAPTAMPDSRTWWPGLIWLSGFGLMLGRSGLARFVLLLVRHRRRAVTDEVLLARVRDLSRRLGIRRRVRVMEANSLSGPIAWGLFRPEICLPERFAGEFTVGQQEAMLAHELAHVAARDPAWYWFGDLAAALWWWHPLAWWTRGKLQATSEQAADEASLLVENGPDALAECLVEIGRRLVRPHSFVRLGIDGNGFRSGLGQRVARLLELSGNPWRGVGQARLWLARASGLAALALIVLAGSAWSSRPRGETFQQNWQGSLAGYAWTAFAKTNPRILLAQAAPPPGSATAEEGANRIAGLPARSATPADRPTQEAANDGSRLVANEQEPLHTRWFKIDPDTSVQGLRDMLGTNRFPANPTNAELATAEGLRDFIKAIGVDLSPPKSVFYSDRRGDLMVRATLADLDAIEQAVQVLNTSPPQVTIEVKFAEVSEDEIGGAELLASIGYDLNMKVTSPTTNAPPRTTSATDLSPPVLTRILTPPQFRVILRRLEQQKGVDLLTTPKITTLSSRPAQIKDVDVKYIETKIEDSQNGPQPIAERFELGSILDVVPYVAADGYTIQMTIIPTVREFLGYYLDASKKFQATFLPGVEQPPESDAKAAEQFSGATPFTSAMPLPIFRIRQVCASAIVWDGQTVVLGPGSVEVEDSSHHEAAGATKKIRKHLLVFVTPTIVDPAGNRVHSDEELPFRQNAVPPQKTGK
jgi:beta-lactamase regulating signal transducer with metallopeptidase domain